MASTYNHQTALRIYKTIEGTGSGVTAEGLAESLNLNKNTIFIYTRRLIAEGCIAVWEEQSKPGSPPINIYKAIRTPVIPLSDSEKVTRAIEVLAGIALDPRSFSKKQCIDAIQDAVKFLS